MTIVSRIEGRLAPLLNHHSKPAPMKAGTSRRRSWTSPRLTDSLTPVEESMVAALEKASEHIASLASNFSVENFTDAQLAALVEQVIPLGLEENSPVLAGILTQLVIEEITQAAAEAMHATFAANLTETQGAMLASQHRMQLAGARLTGVPLPSQSSPPAPPHYPPPPPSWIRYAPPGTPGPEAWFNLRLDLVNPYAVQYARSMSMRLAGQITRNTVDAVRGTIAFGYENGWTVEHMAEAIGDKVGLFPKWARAVDRFEQGMLKKGSDPQWARGQAARYAKRLRKKRAMMISRTETMRASNYGRMAAWEAAGAAGLGNVATWTKEWVTGPKVMQAAKVNPNVDGPCSTCAPMDGKTVTGVKGMFNLPSGAPVLAPPAHPHCRCTILLHPPEPPHWDQLGGRLQWLQDPGDVEDW